MAEFRWPVSRSGYAWQVAHGSYGLANELITCETGEGVWMYEPMKDKPDLFLEFADLTDDDDCLRFAAQHGHLTRDVTVVKRFHAEPGLWEAYMKDAVRYSNLPPTVVSRGDILPQKEGFETILAFPNASSDPVFETRVEVDYQPEDGQLWSNHVAEMKLLIQDWRTRPDERRLEIIRRRIEAVLARRVVFAFDSTTGWPSLTPTDLLSALWLQFAYAVSGAREYRPCKRCSKLFPISNLNPTNKRRTRSDKLYCTPQCQTAAAYDVRKPKRQKAAAKAKRKKGSSSGAKSKPRKR